MIKIDPNLQFSNITFCDDSKTKRSNQKTTNVVNGRKKRGKDIDQDAKNCMFPFKELKGQGRGKPKKAVVRNECVKEGENEWCATERNPDCTYKKRAYCKK